MEEQELPEYLAPFSGLLPTRWPDAGGKVPSADTIAKAMSLGAAPNTKNGLAWVMYCRPEGATANQVAAVCGDTKFNRARNAAKAGKVSFTQSKGDDGRLIYFMGPPEREDAGRSMGINVEEAPTQMNEDEQVWLISPGFNAVFWEEWKHDGIISIGWDEVGNLQGFATLEAVRGRLTEAYEDQASAVNARACFEFAHIMKPGDLVFAKEGRSNILGLGRVIGAYHFDDTRLEHHHVRRVEWLRSGSWPYSGPRIFPMKALTDITKNIELRDALMHLVGASDGAKDAIGYDEPPFNTIVESIKKQGMLLAGDIVHRYHLSLKTRGFVILSGNSGTGKTWLADAYAISVGAERIIVPVAPNWTTNEDLLGYFNPINDTYHDTPFSGFLKRAEGEFLRASENKIKPTPYHLILDEMNLARVEYYFAKFLSCMEIRARKGEAALELAPGKCVMLPPNLFVVGTVNVDETTQSFADKVYDRAQLIELNSPRELIAQHLGGRPYGELILKAWDAVSAVAPFAYRTIEEIHAYTSEANRLEINWETAVDHQLLQKVLTKIKGADPRIEAALARLIEIGGEKLPQTVAKARLMLERYQQHGFTSYF